MDVQDRRTMNRRSTDGNQFDVAVVAVGVICTIQSLMLLVSLSTIANLKGDIGNVRHSVSEVTGIIKHCIEDGG